MKLKTSKLITFDQRRPCTSKAHERDESGFHLLFLFVFQFVQ